jgi:hypothetical protein
MYPHTKIQKKVGIFELTAFQENGETDFQYTIKADGYLAMHNDQTGAIELQKEHIADLLHVVQSIKSYQEKIEHDYHMYQIARYSNK